MKRLSLSAFLCLLSILLFADLGRTCTSFCIPYKGGWVFGKNFDWTVDDGLVVVNKRNVSKVAGPEEDAFRWTSKYGSVTFDMYGVGMPMGGVNEKGLVIENMWLAGTVYPEPDSRPQISELQWIQYQLDTAATVREVLASESRVRLGSQYGVPLHFLISDGKGECATVECLEGKMVYHTKDTMPVMVLANNTYDESVDYFSDYAARDTSAAHRDRSSSPERFAGAARRLEEYDAKESGSPVDYAFAVLDSVSDEITQWSIVYDPKDARVYFRTRSNRDIRYVDLKAFDYSCAAPMKVFDILSDGSGDVSKAFVDYSYDLNLDLIRSVFSKTSFLKDTPPEQIQSLARYPEFMECTK